MILLLIAAIAAGAQSPPDAKEEGKGEARAVVERQMASPPRYGQRLSPDEAAIIYRNYLQSIGRRLSSTGRGSPGGP